MGRAHRRHASIALVLALSAWAPCLGAGCGDDSATPTDAGPADAAAPDARTPTPLSLRVDGDGASLVVDTDPLRFHVERPDGSVVVASAMGDGLAFGHAGGGDTRFHSPVSPPRNVTFEPLDFGLSMTSPTSATIGDADGRRATLTLSAPAPGVLRMHLSRDPSVSDVALSRLGLTADDGGYYGLGEQFDGPDARGKVLAMQLALDTTRVSGTNDRHVPVPFFVSTKGYGVFVKSRQAGAFDVASTDPHAVTATFEGGDLDVYFYVDADPLEVVAKYTRQTGLPRLPPRWAFAPMQWRNEWNTIDVLRQDRDTIRTDHIPCTAFWIDNPWESSYNDMEFDTTRFPDPPTMLANLRAMGYEPVLWSTPYLEEVSDGATPTNDAESLFVTAKANGWLVRTASGAPFIGPSAPGAPGSLIDFTSDAASAFWTSRLAPLVAMGVRGFKLDFAEDILVEVLDSRLGLQFSDGSTERTMHSLYPLLYDQAYRNALDAGDGGEGGFLIVRASSWGGQADADIIWPGDLDNDFREATGGQVGGLPAAVSALTSLAASGFPTFGSDTGGFRDGMPTREALLRWAEHTAFSPILELGGGGDHHNPWLYDAAAGDIYRTLAQAHMALVPYLRMNAIRASTTGRPPVAAPALAFPNDPGSASDPYAYMLGDDIFVAPVVTEGATTRSLHLPPGTWFHWFTGMRYTGPSDVTVDAPIGTPPVFIRQGAVLPLSPADLDTLAPADAPTIDPADRPYLRAWLFPAGDRTITTESGITLRSNRTASDLTLTVTPTAGGLDDLRMRIELADADPSLTGMSTVESGGTAVAVSTDAATVQAGCDGVCWYRDGDTLYVSVRGATATAITVR